MTARLPSPSPRLLALDSDGTVFPNMPLKFRVMLDTIIEHYGLQRAPEAAERVVRFFNLESRWRGGHRFVLLAEILDALRNQPEVRATGIQVPSAAPLRQYLTEGGARSNEALARAARRDPTGELSRALRWSTEVSARLAALPAVPPFTEAAIALRELRDDAVRRVVVSQAPLDQIRREWSGADLARYVDRLWGSEIGPKPGQLERAMREFGVPPERTLLLGDSAGDLEAARVCGARFYPIVPGREEDSWRRFRVEIWPLWLAGGYGEAEQTAHALELERALPSQPSWL
ncbi:MAG: HAD hydrolase-like protein [Kiritimatiellae bacterium]|nr:HAD hydrolase-like protein [Kiritimatiellia bacterium]